MSNENIINEWLKTYLIGPMEDVEKKDGGRGWRTSITKKLNKLRDVKDNSVYIFDPTLEEQNKTGMEAETLHMKIKGWLAGGNNDLVEEYAGLIWKGKTHLERTEEGQARLIKVLGDVDYVVNSHFLIARMEKGDSPCVDKNTLVTMSNLSQKKIKDIKIGDAVLGVKTEGRTTRFVSSKVYNVINQGKKSCNKLKGQVNTITCTSDHEFLKACNKANVYCSNSKIIKKNYKCWEIDTINQNNDFFMGWIKGYVKHDFNLNKNNSRVCASCLSDKLSEIKDIQNILLKFNIKSYIRKIKSIRDVRFKTQKDFYYLLKITDKKNFEKLSKIANMLSSSREFDCGYITGSIDADGWYDLSDIRYSQSIVNQENYDEIVRTLNKLNVHYTSQLRTRNSNLHKTKQYSAYALQISKNNIFLFPSQFDYKRKITNRVISRITKKSVLQKQVSSINTVYDIGTSTGNFIGNGFIIHNCGTFMECGIALEHNIPIYVLQTMPRVDYKGSFCHAVFATKGGFFSSDNELIEFLKKKYDLVSVKE